MYLFDGLHLSVAVAGSSVDKILGDDKADRQDDELDRCLRTCPGGGPLQNGFEGPKFAWKGSRTQGNDYTEDCEGVVSHDVR